MMDDPVSPSAKNGATVVLASGGVESAALLSCERMLLGREAAYALAAAAHSRRPCMLGLPVGRGPARLALPGHAAAP